MLIGLLDTGVANVASMTAAFQRLGVDVRLCSSDDQVDHAVTHVVLPGVGAFGAVRGLRERGLDRTVRRVVDAGTPFLAVCLGLQMLCDDSDEAPGVTGLAIIPGTCRSLAEPAKPFANMTGAGLPSDPGVDPDLETRVIDRPIGRHDSSITDHGSSNVRSAPSDTDTAHDPSHVAVSMHRHHAVVPHLGWNEVVPESAGLVKRGAAAFANSYALLDAPAGWKVAWTLHGQKFVAALERDNVLACQFHPELSGSYGQELIRRWLYGATGGVVSDATQPSAAAPGSTPAASSTTNKDVNPGTPVAGVPGDIPDSRSAPSLVTSRIIPCLDVEHGRVVKGVQFQELRDIGEPAACAHRYQIEGADEIVVLDIAAAPDGLGHRTDVVRAVRRDVGIPLTVGGGVRSVDDARALLAAGADKVSVNTAAVKRPRLVRDMAEEFGCQCVVVAIDAKRVAGGWQVRTVGGREANDLDAVAWAVECVERGAGEILLTSWDRDGTRSGYDTALITAVTDRVQVPVIASGGGGTGQDVLTAFRAGAHAVLAASIFHDRDMTVQQLKEFLSEHNVRVRM